MNGRYILDEQHNPVPEEDLMTWAQWMEAGNRRVALDQLSDKLKVSTVFLGLDHSFEGDTPILFETMIFGGDHDQYQERYATWNEALEGHAKAVALAPTKE